MRAKAPGKVVISGAYAVLHGAPALVAAADRYVLADSSRPATFETPEVRAALGVGRAAPWFDASALRDGERKLGLGSSAAILVASLAALELERDAELSGASLVERVVPSALLAHAQAQGGGSGIDVAASAHGGFLLARRAPAGLELRPIEVPAGLCIRVLAARASASTSQFVARVRDLAERDPRAHARCMGAQAEAAERAAEAALSGQLEAFVAALAAQQEALSALGAAAGIAIVTPEVAELARAARGQGAAALPAGAGGGDIALWVAARGEPPPPRLAGLVELDLTLGAAGVARAD